MTIAIKILDRALEACVCELMDHASHVPKEFMGNVWKLELCFAFFNVVFSPFSQSVKGGTDTIKKVHLNSPIHPSIQESITVIDSYFEDYALNKQDLFG
eukprot:g32883.t1